MRVKAAAWSSEHVADPKVISDHFKLICYALSRVNEPKSGDDGNPVLRSPFRSQVAVIYFDSSDVDDDVINSLSRSTLDGVKDVKLINGSRLLRV